MGSTRRSPTAEVTPALRAKALLVHERLCAEYGCPIAFFHELDPLSELVSSLLSHRTKNADSGRAFRQLRARFPTWEAVRDAPTADVEAAIAPVTWPEQKAPRLQAVLREIAERRGTLADDALDFLGELPAAEARAWLESITGVGPKTSAAVLLFSRLRVPALPVDSHHHRVAERLGLLPGGVAVGPAHAILAAQLPPEWDAQRVYDDHEALMLHGQRCCFWRDPACARCVVLDLCPTGQTRLGRGREAGAERSLPDATLAPPAAYAATARVARSAAARPRTAASRATSHAAHAPVEGDRAPDLGEPNMPHDQPKGLDARHGGSQPHAPENRPTDDVNDPEHSRMSAASKAHGTHGKGRNEELLSDPQATDTGDDAQQRRAGGGGDQAPDPQAFRDQSAGHMGGSGWGSEQVGGSVVDRRPPDPKTGDDRRHA